MRWYMNRGCLAVLVSGFCLLGFAVGGADAPADKEALRYDGKPFEYWRTYLRTELKAERRIDALRAMAAFGVRGHAQSATTAIIDVVKDYREHGYGGDAEHQTPDQKVIETANEALIQIGPAAFEIVLRNAKDPIVREIAESWYFWHRKENKLNVLSASAARTLLEYAKGDDIEVRHFAVEMLGDAIHYDPPSKKNALAVLRAEKETGRLVRALIQVLDAGDSGAYAVDVLAILGPRAKDAAASMAKARLQGVYVSDEQLTAIGVEAKELIPDIAKGLTSQKVEVRTRAAEWLAKMGAQAKPALPALLHVLNEGPKKKTNSESPLESWGSTYSVSSDFTYQGSDEEEKAWLADLGALQRMGAETRKLVPSLIRVLADGKRTDGCRIIVANVLGEMGVAARDALPALREAAKDREEALRKAAVEAIAKIEAKEQK